MTEKVKTLLVGKPLDLTDKRVFQHISLVAFLAWVGLGADGLSSSCYGPSEAFGHLREHYLLAIFLALATMFTVVVISACYSHIIEAFPSGGGGYLVASKMLGPAYGVVSGSALIVDYVLTVTVSIAAAGDALLGLAGPHAQFWKLPLPFTIARTEPRRSVKYQPAGPVCALPVSCHFSPPNSWRNSPPRKQKMTVLHESTF